MIFNSYKFILIFLPVTVVGFWLSARIGGRVSAMVWLTMSSVAFCAWAGVKSLAVMAAMIGANYLCARAMLRGDTARASMRTFVFTFGICLNIMLLIYFKHEGMFLDFFNTFVRTRFDLHQVALPLGVSFLTFQMIGFLADVYYGHLREIRWLEYLLFAFFFPRAVAGPIVHYREIVPQFAQFNSRTLRDHAPVAICLFSIGLFKKAFVADGLAPFVTPTFDLAPATEAPAFITAWFAILAVSLQIYFDFSGYTDMALGVARLFGVRLPMNFNSPFKATSITDLWRRDHITLTLFLTEYVYAPIMIYLAQSRLARKLLTRTPQRFKPLINATVTCPATLITTAVSGLWHGTSWQFLLWGTLHGVYLVINQMWRTARPLLWADRSSYERVMQPVGFILTFVCALAAVVFFRANSVDCALSIFRGAAGLHGFFPAEWALLSRLGFDTWFILYQFRNFAWVIALILVVTLSPNTMEILRRFQPALYFTARVTEPLPDQASSTISRAQSCGQEVTPFSKKISPAWIAIRAIRQFIQDGIRLNRVTATLIALVCALGILALNDGSNFIYARF